MYFEVDGIATKVTRKVHNFEDALGWVGGIIGIVAMIVKYSIAPFITNNIGIAISSATA